MSREPVLIISTVAEVYAGLLADLPVTAATGSAAAMDAYAGQEVVLGEPELVAAALPAMPHVRWVQSTWAGVKPLLAPASRGLLVTGVKDVFGPQMADYAIGYMLARELDILGRFEKQRARHWDETDTGGLEGKLLGIMGTGSIGAHIALKAACMGMRVQGYSRSGRPVAPFEAVFPGDRLSEFLADLDYLVAVLPDTPESTDLLDERAFEAMPDHCCLINVGRGNVVAETALVAALEQGRLGAAVLDVFKHEPLPPDHPFWTTPNLLLTAHVAARSYPEDIAEIFRANYRRYLAGQPLDYLIDPTRGY